MEEEDRGGGSPGKETARSTDAADGTAVDSAETIAATRQRTGSASPASMQRVWARAVAARVYDIVPTMAAPQATSINALAVTPDLRFIMTGGSDGYIRKYDGPGTINGKQLLTVAQRHPFVDSVVKAGILMSAAEDHILSPVYSLAVHSHALWLLAGTEGGGINLQSVRHDEGKRITSLLGHSNAVSVLQLAPDERSVLSGSWDKNIFDWDLNTGHVRRHFDGTGGQVSAIELRPASGAPIPSQDDHQPLTNGVSVRDGPTSGEINGETGLGTAAGVGVGPSASGASATINGDDPIPDHESLFGSPVVPLYGGMGENSFGDDDGGMVTAIDSFEQDVDMVLDSSNNNEAAATDAFGDSFGADTAASVSALSASAAALPLDDDPPATDPMVDQPSTPAALQQQLSAQTHGPDFADAPLLSSSAAEPPASQTEPSSQATQTAADATQTSLIKSEAALPSQHGSPPPVSSPSALVYSSQPPPAEFDPTQISETTFFSASIDGTIRIWDRRQSLPIARIGNRPGVPPWCMGACWSPDGNRIYAGRRNGIVEEFDIHRARSSWKPERSLRFPAGSGPVSAVRAMVNGRHLVCASHDILRLYDLNDAASKTSSVPFLIIPGPPRAGVISHLYIDRTSRYMFSTAGTRGWEGTSTEALIGYEINSVVG
ncbi:transcription factor [Grosmannia clavigera kw1407]|uniref:Transcription factor n=1 Tax=Grosmannia clavigera (strain kw1407 / UAMH 11150) TaxID=655863 RepID=F0XB05_GROCL|nr:transcription factor [Grosmannia clavigera kw1407]EFX05165.1 transcription factor [Grosmannia clavigera kw1407]